MNKKSSIQQLIQNYLSGQITQKEKDILLDMVLKELNHICYTIQKFNQNLKIKGK